MLFRQRGLSLLEILGAIAVSTVMFIGLIDMINVSLEDARGQQAAFHQAQVVEAAQKHIAANYPTLKTATASGAVVAVTVPDLKAGGFLPNSFADTNSYQQNTCVLVRQDLTVGKLNALVTTYGGKPIPDRAVAAVAMNAGQGAGYINSSDLATARGPSWSLNTTPYRSGTCLSSVKPLNGTAGDAGHLVSNIFYDGPGQLSTDFIYRDAVPGRPDLNRMNVPLQMASAALVNVGDSCTQTALAIESTSKDVVVCDGGVWRYSSSSWKDSVANYAALASVSKKNGDVRVTRDTGRAFVYRSGSNTWTALAVDQNGDLDVPGSVDIGGGLHAGQHIYTDADLHVAQNAYIEGTLRANGNVVAAQNVNIGNKLTIAGDIDAQGNMDIEGYLRGKGEVRGDWMAAAMIVLSPLAFAGAPCHKVVGNTVYNPQGTVALDFNRLLISCTNESVFRYANGTNSP